MGARRHLGGLTRRTNSNTDMIHHTTRGEQWPLIISTHSHLLYSSTMPLMTPRDASRIQSTQVGWAWVLTQAKSGRDMSARGFAARSQSAAARNTQVDKVWVSEKGAVEVERTQRSVRE